MSQRSPYLTTVCYKQCPHCKWFTNWLWPRKKRGSVDSPVLSNVIGLCAWCKSLPEYYDPRVEYDFTSAVVLSEARQVHQPEASEPSGRLPRLRKFLHRIHHQLRSWAKVL